MSGNRSIEKRLHWGLVVWMGWAVLRIAGTEGLGATNNTVAPSDPVAGRSHWAFRPLERKDPGVGKVGAGWAQTAVDEYLVGRMAAVGLKPAGDASRAVRLRRLYFGLVGLPPSPEAVEAFGRDDRPDAWERQVEALLGSPGFGERWGRHWLDLARYADSNGLDENFLFREAWRYRNWVIGAWNADVAFDRFVVEQLAGDLLPWGTIEERDRQRIAAGFLVVGPKVLLGNDPARQRMEVADEQVDTVGRAFLGLTLGCARCHDHKFEPVPRSDYYAMAGIFTSTRVMEQRYMLGEQRVMERLVGLGRDGDALDASYEKFWLEFPANRERIAQAKSALGFLQKGDTNGVKGVWEKSRESVAALAGNPDAPIDLRIGAQKSHVAAMEAAVGKPPPIPPRAMIPCDVESPADEAIRVSGQFDRLGDRVTRGGLRVLTPGAGLKIGDKSSGRLELARWLTDCDGGAGNLTARVLANRIWQHLMGRGIVPTSDNFGRTGEGATHPELLDYLALELVRSGWSTKALIRRIVLSRAYGMSSATDAVGEERDPENRYWWRAERRRLEPEAIRDSMLSVAGGLDLAGMGSTVWYLGDQATAVGKNEVRRRTDFPCRSVYLPVIRNDLPELFQSFDFADPHVTTGARPRTASATQALYLMNDVTVMGAAERFADRVMREFAGAGVEERVEWMYRRAVGMRPNDRERRVLADAVVEFLRRGREEGLPQAERRAWALAAQSLFAMSRFQYLD